MDSEQLAGVGMGMHLLVHRGSDPTVRKEVTYVDREWVHTRERKFHRATAVSDCGNYRAWLHLDLPLPTIRRSFA